MKKKSTILLIKVLKCDDKLTRIISKFQTFKCAPNNGQLTRTLFHTDTCTDTSEHEGFYFLCKVFNYF